MKKEYIERQRDIRDCGCCCLLSIIKFYNGYVPLETIRIDTQTNNEGTSAFHIIKSANKYGFDGIGVNINYDDLLSSTHNLPAIAQIKLENNLLHFVVVYDVTKTTITLMDPAKGYQKVSKEKFINEWTGVLIILKPRENILVLPKTPSIFSLFANVLREEKTLFKEILISSLLITILTITTSFYLKVAINLMEYNEPKLIYILIFIFTSLTFLKIVIQHQRSCYEIHLNKNIDGKITVPFLKHLFSLPLRVIKSRSSGEIVTRVSELNAIKELFTEIFLAVFLDSFLAFCSIYILLMISKELFFLLCLLLILYIAVSILFSPFIYQKINDNIELETEYNAKLVEYVSNIETIKNLNLVNKMKKDMEMSAVGYLKNTFLFNKLIMNESSLQRFIYEIGLLSITSLGLYLIMKEQLSLVNLITFTSLLTYFLEPIKNMADILPKYNYIKASFRKISDFNSLPEEGLIENNERIEGMIEFQNVSYSYNGLQPILNDFSCEIGQGMHCFIAGESGAGKSTMCKLLLKYDENYQGNICIGGVNIKDCNIQTIRNNITYVSQNERLFTGTIKQNITLDETVDITKLNEVIKLCEIEEIIKKKPLRLDTMLLDAGVNLSGGEKQRLILARALLQDKNIIILDEALNEVEEEKEIKIIKEINKTYKEKTILYISHRKHKKLFQTTITLGGNHEVL